MATYHSQRVRLTLGQYVAPPPKWAGTYGSNRPFAPIGWTPFSAALTGRVRARAPVFGVCSVVYLPPLPRSYLPFLTDIHLPFCFEAKRFLWGGKVRRRAQNLKSRDSTKGAERRAQTWRKKRASFLRSNHGSSWYAGKLKGGLVGGFGPTKIRVMRLRGFS